MTYAQYGIVQAADFNTNATNVNDIWATGSGSTGYGQTAIPLVNVGTIVTAENPTSTYVEWANMIRIVNRIINWQSAGISPITAPVRYDTITWFNNFVSSVNTLSTAPNRYRSPTIVQVATGTNSHSTPWGGGTTAQLTCAATVSFPTFDTARYFFNTGGQLNYSLTYSAGAGPLSAVWSGIIPSPGGRNYTLTPTDYWAGSGSTVITGTGSPAAYAGESLTVTTSGLGTQTVTFTTILRDNYTNPFVSDAIAGTFTITVTASHAPSDANLTIASWTPNPTITVPNF